MPANQLTYQERLAQILIKKEQWFIDVCALFQDILVSDNELLEAFKSRQSLMMDSGHDFPQDSTAVDELEQALIALEQGDVSTYKRFTKDAGRSLQISEEVNAVREAIYPEVFTLASLIPLSRKLKYDAVCFYVCGTQIYDSRYEMGRLLLALGADFPDEVEDITSYQRALEPALKARLAGEILRIEYEHIKNLIDNDNSLCREAIEEFNQRLCPMDTAKPTLLNAAIVQSHGFYQQQKEQSDRRIWQYQQNKEQIAAVLADVTLSAVLKSTGQQLLAQLCNAENTQSSIASIAQHGNQEIYLWLNEVNRNKNALEHECSKAKSALITVLARTDIDESVKINGYELIKEYQAIEGRTALDLLQQMAKKLMAESLAIPEQEQLRVVRLNYSDLSAKLVTQLQYRCISAQLKTQGQQFLAFGSSNTPLATMNLSISRCKTILSLIDNELNEIANKCTKAKTALIAVLARTDIDDSVKVRGHALLERYSSSEQYFALDDLYQLAKKLMAESQAITLQQEYRVQIKNLGNLVADDYIPERLKQQAKSLLGVPWNTANPANAIGHVNDMTQEIGRIAHAVKIIEDSNVGIVNNLKTQIANPYFRDTLKAPARQLLSQYLDQQEKHSPLDCIGLCVAEIVRTSSLIYGQEQKARARDELSYLLADNTIPEQYKVQGRALCADAEASYQQMNAASRDIRASVALLIDRGAADAARLSAVLSNSAYADAFKIRGRAQLTAYQQQANENKTLLTDLLGQAKSLSEEAGVIKAKQHMKNHYFTAVIAKMSAMNSYGIKLTAQDNDKGRAVCALANSLNSKIDHFINTASNHNLDKDTLDEFVAGFKRTLHAQDDVMSTHRALWKPIVTNLMIAFSGIGLLALIAKNIYLAVQATRGGEPVSFNRALFFAKTNSEQQIQDIEQSLVLIPSPL